MAKSRPNTADIIKSDTKGILADWLTELRTLTVDSRIEISEVESQATELMRLIARASQSNLDPTTAEWQAVREFLEGISRTRAAQGLTSTETATFVFSFKKPLFARLRSAAGSDAATTAAETWVITELIDKLGLHTVDAFQKAVKK